MTFMDGLIILASDGRPLITSRFTSSNSSLGSQGASGNSSGSRAAYARVHVDRYNEEVLQALDTAAYERLVRAGPRNADAGAAGKGKAKADADNWFGSIVLQEAFAGKKIDNPALEGPDPFGRDDEDDEDLEGLRAEEGLLSHRGVPAAGQSLPRLRSLDSAPPILRVDDVAPLGLVSTLEDDLSEEEEEEEDDEEDAAASPVDLLAPTPVKPEDNVWHQETTSNKPAAGPEKQDAEAPTPEEDNADIVPAAPPRPATALIHKTHNDLHFLIPLSTEGSPTLPLSFLSLFIRTLSLYVGGASLLTEDAVRDNFDVIYQILEEMLDDGGSWPLTTDANLLMHIVPPEQGWLKTAERYVQKVGAGLSAQQGPPSAATVLNAAISSPVPWRMPMLRSPNNEIFIDVVETLEGTFGRDGRLRRANLHATLLCRTRLTGMPEILLTLSRVDQLQAPSFHPCVRSRKWKKEKVLSFIPPDGAAELASFRVGAPHTVEPFAPTETRPFPPTMPDPANGSEHAVPVRCKCTMRSGPLENDGTKRAIDFVLDVQLNALPSDRVVQNLVVSFELPEDATSIDAALSAEQPNTGFGSSNGNGSASMRSSAAQQDTAEAGSFLYDATLHVFKWSVPRARSGCTLRAKGSFETYDWAPRPASNVTLQCQVPMHGVSGVKVDGLVVQGEAYTPFKGVRNVLNADLEFRWS